MNKKSKRIAFRQSGSKIIKARPDRLNLLILFVSCLFVLPTFTREREKKHFEIQLIMRINDKIRRFEVMITSKRRIFSLIFNIKEKEREQNRKRNILWGWPRGSNHY